MSPSPTRPPIKSFGDVLLAAGKRPAPGSGEGSSYSTRFANAMAVFVANALRERFPEIQPDTRGKGVESPARSARGSKKLDVNYSTARAGLGLGISLKSVHVRDKKPERRFHHNMKRNDEELRVEAAGYHKRQPYSVLVAVVMLPFEACEDADKRPSSFGMWVQYLWPLAGRSDPHDDFDQFEHAFVALYEPDGSDLKFFDVMVPPPKEGRPTAEKLLSLEAFVEKVATTYERRNALDFRWESGEVEPAELTGEEDEND